MLTVRPKVAELVFQLYGRALHPELFEVHSSRTIKRGDYEATVNITSAGHVVTWRYHGPDADRSCHERSSPAAAEASSGLVSAERAREPIASSVAAAPATRSAFNLEPVAPEVFWTFQQELAYDGKQQGMLYRFDSSGRMALGALELHQSRSSQSQPAGAGLPHVSRRLRDRQKPIAVRSAVRPGVGNLSALLRLFSDLGGRSSR